jgi:hypothetical protein
MPSLNDARLQCLALQHFTDAPPSDGIDGPGLEDFQTRSELGPLLALLERREGGRAGFGADAIERHRGKAGGGSVVHRPAQDAVDGAGVAGGLAEGRRRMGGTNGPRGAAAPGGGGAAVGTVGGPRGSRGSGCTAGGPRAGHGAVQVCGERSEAL